MKDELHGHKQKILNINLGILKTDIVFSISMLLAAISCFVHTPKMDYIDFKVLLSLFNLMIAIKAFEDLKVLDKLAIVILNKCHTSRKISLILILLCFFSSMLVTNDVALITFIPLTLIISQITKTGMVDTIILQTIAANLGSSLTPMGNPQNLFIYSYFGISPLQFFTAVLLLAPLGLIILTLLNQRINHTSLQLELPLVSLGSKIKPVIWFVVFCLITASILGALSYKAAFVITLGTAFILDIKLFKKIDYLLLVTFICFFIFIGNISDLSSVHSLVSKHLKSPSSIYFGSILLSQLISNVPAAIFLAKFSLNWQPLLLGVNLGGLGTIIASLASVISYKLFIKKQPSGSQKYLIRFSLYNFSILTILTLVYYFIMMNQASSMIGNWLTNL